MKLNNIFLSLLWLAILGLPACGGGGGGGIAGVGGGGIGGTGVSSTGTIDGFGSIFVNGVEYETTDSEVSLDGQPANAGSLRLGMVVTVQGTINDDGKTGTADQVIFDDEVQGPITAIDPGQDGDSLLLTVLGVKVIVERTGTVFDDVTFDTLAVGDQVEVSGFRENGQQIRATRIEKQSTFEPGASEVELKGVVTGLSATTFTLNSVVVDFSGANLTDIPGGTLSEGMTVEVRGTLTDNLIVASRVDQEDDFTSGLEVHEDVTIQGAINNFVDASNFTVNGVKVNAGSAALEPAGLILANDVVVEVEGVWDGTTLIAEEVKSRRGRIELEAKVASVNAAQGSITMQYFAGSVVVLVDNRTQMDDDTDKVDSLALSDIATGDFLEVEASRIGADLVASRVRREETADDVIQAHVDSFNAGVDITVLGILFNTAGAQFQGHDDDTVTAEAFFAQLQGGDLVKIKDKEPADGVADEVEFENDHALDGEEFEDDCNTGGSDDDCNSGGDDDDDVDCDNSGPNDDCNSGGDDGDDDGVDCDNSGPNEDCNSGGGDDGDDNIDCDSSIPSDTCDSGDDGTESEDD